MIGTCFRFHFILFKVNFILRYYYFLNKSSNLKQKTFSATNLFKLDRSYLLNILPTLIIF